ncbi:hypothetical protein [Brevundimonas sp.]|uniref:hypothetical protein n=1 Tax=Brevundimonas sp. TaxID=1871086 RepID=UPI0035B3A185
MRHSGLYTYNLPPIITDGPLAEAKKAGAWTSIDHLDKLADALFIGEKQAERSDVKSIPDPWAQMLVFDRALFDASHPLHTTVLPQWRALIATIALMPEFSAAYTLTAQPVDLEGSRRNSLFARTLLDLEPARVLVPELSWKRPVALMIQERGGSGTFAFGPGRPLGFLTPTALVAAGRASEQVRCPDVPWLKDGLSDPIDAALSERQFRILADYIRQMWTRLSARDDLEPRLRGGLAQALEAFHRAANAKAAPEVRGLNPATIDLAWPSPLHAQVLGSTWQFDGTSVPPTEADAAIELSPPARSLFKGAILVDPDLAETLGKRPESISVWGRHSLADAMRPATFDIIRQEAEAEGWLVIRPSDLFTDSLITLDSQTINEAHPAAFQSALLPLSPLALMLVPGQGLAEALDMSPSSGDAVVRLRLRLQSGRPHAVRRDLPRADQSKQVLQVPDDLAFWPNFQAPGWRWTFLHFTASINYYMRPRFAVTAEVMASQVRGASLDMSDRARRIRLWSDSSTLAIDDLFGFVPPASALQPERISTVRGTTANGQQKVLVERIGFTATDQGVAELHHLPGGADAVFFARKTATGDFVPAGMALVRFAQTRSSALEAKVAVDFGTTNTVVYTERNGLRERLTFQDRIVFPFGVRAKQARRREELVGQYLGFFPLQKHETPFPTVAKLREFRPALPPELQARVREGRMHQHGFADNVFFVPNFDGFIARQADLGLSDNIFREWTGAGLLKFRLKWGETQSERALATHFLRQIMMMSAAELVAEGTDPLAIDWRFSYPQAFKPSQHRQLENELRRNWSALFGPAGDTTANGRPTFLRKTEGAAAAHVFVTQGAEKLMLVLDIGGGTTDIALWRDGKPFWRNSFKVAGGDFFTAYLANNPDVLRKIDMSEVSTGLSEGDPLSADGRRDFVELYVNKPAFAQRFADNFGLLASEPAGLGLQQVASVALGGLMYYVGLVLGQLVADPNSGLRRADLDRLTVAFAGRGSTLFRQFHTGGSDDELTQLVRLAIAAAEYNPTDVAIQFRFSGPHEAKHEVAQGLLVDRREDPTGGESRLAVLGEDIDVMVGGVETQALATAPLTALQSASEVDRIELAHLSRFLIALRKLTDINIDIEQRGALNDIRAKVRQNLSDSLHDLDADAFTDEDAQPFEPPFITALRELVSIMALPLIERDRRIVVRDI